MAEFKILVFQNPEFKILGILDFGLTQDYSVLNREFMILADFKNLVDSKILASQNAELKILVDFKILALQYSEYKILTFQNHEFKMLADFQILAFPNPQLTILAEF